MFRKNALIFFKSF